MSVAATPKHRRSFFKPLYDRWGLLAGGGNGLHACLFISFYCYTFGEANTCRGRSLGVMDDAQTILIQVSFNIDR
jgi:hypothetical protein